MRVHALLTVSLAPLAALSMPLTLFKKLPPAVQKFDYRKDLAPIWTTPPTHTGAEVILDVEDAAVQVAFNNGPVTPSVSSTPEEVLDSPNPVATSYLLSLGESSRRKAAEIAQDVWEAVEPTTVTDMRTRPARGHRHDADKHTRTRTMGCRYMRVARDHNERLIVFLVLAFVSAVLLVETGAAVYGYLRRKASGQGAIRLEEDEESNQPLSVRADTPSAECTRAVAEPVEVIIEMKDEKAPLWSH